MVLSSQISSVARSVAGQNERIEAQRMKVFEQDGEFTLVIPADSTESIVEVDFVNTFIEKPRFSSGIELAPNQLIQVGNYPIATVFVVSWITAGANATQVWTGVRLGVKLSASELTGTQWVIHYTFKGRALAFPAIANPSNGTGTA